MGIFKLAGWNLPFSVLGVGMRYFTKNWNMIYLHGSLSESWINGTACSWKIAERSIFGICASMSWQADQYRSISWIGTLREDG
jgi:hypothetical protein